MGDRGGKALGSAGGPIGGWECPGHAASGAATVDSVQKIGEQALKVNFYNGNPA